MDNNVVIAINTHARGFSPFIDTRPGVPANERYKAIAGVETRGLRAFVSSDGLNWASVGGGRIYLHRGDV